MNKKYNTLFDRFTFKNGISIKNRLVMAPMTTWASNEDLTISDEEVNFYRRRVNGVGLVITGCTHVTPNGQGFTHEFAAYDDSFIPSLRKLADAAKSGGAPAVLQIFHGGARALPDLDVVSASSVKFPMPGTKEPRALSNEEIISIIHAFGETTRRAIEAGFDGVEIHGAHAFLIQNFFSPQTNTRTDEWGGTIENRMRFPIAVIEVVKKVIQEHAKKSFILGYRFSPEERGGYGLEDTYQLIDRLIEQGLDYIHASLDDVSLKPMDKEDGQSRLELILEKVAGRVPVMAAGSMRTPDDALNASALGLPLFALGQALVMNPGWVTLVQEGNEDLIVKELDPQAIKELDIPEKLWRDGIQAMPGWFKIKQEEGR
ncbi:2,4-dienoyl-CoA reductase-like NADH-dependent reductase (Old Yellow Enzyme family) [Paenibacillus phyllosphaerae]|uniref:2,4-dienoyl-CoA reductase-like NADH-dependent reductase (Old Yellow Enzyme family) n=1 Tax=Paenibacillus phyllosphaerae TaxID=274593 RepID=A0A7W5FP92_9BACL|nr:NADH-dependent flavin oxidoreductase [Paenibacillus phyllosphaerae]MBB3112136.1 2,4-dienoyl-CoA reductase-like NADH-dependent reductase (Old Yellow Enzyme family) [Paenibacillus phyllosphaerae]